MSTKFCPFSLKTKDSSIIDPRTKELPEPTVVAAPCLGADCMCAITTVDEQGKAIGVECAFTVGARAMHLQYAAMQTAAMRMASNKH